MTSQRLNGRANVIAIRGFGQDFSQTLLNGRFAVTRSDIRQVALPVLRHRILPSFQAEAEELDADHIVNRLLYEAEAFPSDSTYDAATRKILRL